MRMPFATLERYEEAMETIAQRVRRAAGALEKHGIPYAVVGGNAVAAWVSRVDPEAVRGTRDVDIAIRREDLERAKVAMAEVGFNVREGSAGAAFSDALKPSVRGRIELLFDTSDFPHNPPRSLDGYSIAAMESLVHMELGSFRLKDRVHVRDLIDAGLITPEIERGLPADLMARLQELKDNPDG